MGKPGRKPTQPCGTVAAYKRHSRAGEPACAACRAAWASKQREVYARRRARQAGEEWDAARWAARERIEATRQMLASMEKLEPIHRLPDM